jgi:EmrB/QacA subfamily drug resistance transporter
MPAVVKEPCDQGVILSKGTGAACTPQLGRWILAATILASSMAFIDGTVVNVALPFLQKELNATAIGVQWVVESYSLFLAALLLVGGSLGDRYGRRLIFLIGVIIFALSSVACGLAANIGQLIAARAVQGIGGALLVPGSLAIISASFGEGQRGRAIGTWSGFSAITTAVGPVLGGWLVEHFSWRAAFFLNIPFAAAVLLISLWRVPESRERDLSGSLDLLGALSATLGLGGVVYGLIESSRVGFANPVVIGSLVSGFVILCLFVVNEARVKNPMIPLVLFRSRDFTGANLLTLFLYAALSGFMFFFTLNLIQIQHYSATAAGSSLLPFVVIMFSLSRWSGGLVESLRCSSSFNNWSARGRDWICTLRSTINDCQFLDKLLPSCCCVRFWNGNRRSTFDNNGHGFGSFGTGRGGFRNKQRCLACGWIDSDRGVRSGNASLVRSFVVGKTQCDSDC